MSCLADGHDAVLFDLDGVLYLGPEPVAGAPEALRELRARGRRLAYVTNNASRTPAAVAEQLSRLGMPACAEDIVTSAQAIAVVAAARLPDQAKVLVLGSEALSAELAARGLTPVSAAADGPVAVVQGYDPHLTVGRIQDACAALHRGLPWFASNLDLTIPSERGLLPGMGSYVALIKAAVGRGPDEVAGKPYPPLLRETLGRVGAERPIFVGDRLDTDVEGARAVGMTSLFVLTGAHGKQDLVSASPHQRPDHLGTSVAALLDEPRAVTVTDREATCRGARAWADDGVAHVSAGGGVESQIDALFALAQLCWHRTDAGEVLDPAQALAALTELR